MRTPIPLVLLVLNSAVALPQEQVIHTIAPGVGYRDTEGGSFIDVQETDDGYIVEQFVSAEDADNNIAPDSRAINFGASFSYEGWVKFTFDEFEQSRWIQLKFNPFSEPGGVAGFAGRSWMLPPPLHLFGRDYEFHVLWEGGCDIQALCRNATTSFEYSVMPVEAPLDGDFNYDNRVDFVDFVILSTNFESRTNIAVLTWRDGDVNFDKRVDFDDFQILLENYGTVRESPAAAVPEPAAAVLLGMVLLGVGAVRHRRLPVS